MYNKTPSIAVLLVAAGKGARFGGKTPKQYQTFLGKTILGWNIDLFSQLTEISYIYTVINSQHLHYYQSVIDNRKNVVPEPVSGGETRQESVRKGLEFIALHQKPDYILIHDAARPAISNNLVLEIIAALKTADAVIPGLSVSDTVKRLSAEGSLKTESREGLFTVQTPQAFRFDLIYGLHQKYKGQTVTDDAALCELAGHPVKIIQGDKANIKITHADDWDTLEKTMLQRCDDVRTGKGYDVHRLVDPQHDFHKLKLCGIEVAHDKVLEGHSDADVALHALTDALLATICDGDIGMHFNPKDARWKNADSAQFLKHAANLIRKKNGGIITHVDVTIICEAPKIGPLRDKMRARIGEILDLPVSRISLKATTTEGLGFTGRKEGIAAEAVATVRLPFLSFTNENTDEESDNSASLYPYVQNA